VTTAKVRCDKCFYSDSCQFRTPGCPHYLPVFYDEAVERIEVMQTKVRYMKEIAEYLENCDDDDHSF